MISGWWIAFIIIMVIGFGILILGILENEDGAVVGGLGVMLVGSLIIFDVWLWVQAIVWIIDKANGTPNSLGFWELLGLIFIASHIIGAGSATTTLKS